MAQLWLYGSLYVACSCARSSSRLFIIKNTDFRGPAPPKENEQISLELKRLESAKLKTSFSHLQNTERQSIQVISHNVQSLRAHIDQITNDAAYLHSDMILLNETWTTSDQIFIMLGFQEVARVNVEEDRPMQYGSVCYLSENYFTTHGQYDTIERLWKNHQGSISIAGFNNPDITVISVYISPKCSYIHAIEELDHCLSNSKV
ncbi:hypothetical protein INT47_010793 [Mucor saturninus]|uniref:Uncharacterized protein n=1 Tax=Mucor saturninus TaxID=64648 RepID=A0A8H7UY45_9FUNG|nr:hypothetical protein INT47_010793 [Mucor saturninus]